MKKTNKWLLRKVSGSRAKRTYKPDYSESRNKKQGNIDELPTREPMGKGHTFLDTTLVKRWLYSQTGSDFDDVYSRFLTRIQPKYLDAYRNCIFDYVDKSEEVKYDSNDKIVSCGKPFYIEPSTNILTKYPTPKKDTSTGIISNLLGEFYYEKNTQKWIAKGQYPNIIYNGDITILSPTHLQEIGNYIRKKDQLIQKAILRIDEFAVVNKIPLVKNSSKSLLSIEFVDTEPRWTYHMFFEAAITGNKDWRVTFNNFSIEGVELN